MTLTQTAILTKRLIIIFVISVVLGITAKIGYEIWYQYYLAHLPPVEEKAESKFGILPELKFPPAKVTSSNFTYSLATVTGDLPFFPKFIKVYFMPKAPISLLSAEKAKTIAQSLGFYQEPIVLSETEYKFIENNNTLNINLATNNFFLQKEFPSLSDEDIAQVWSDPNLLIQEFKNYLYKKSLLPEAFNNGQGVFSNSLEASSSATISLWPQSIDDLPILTATNNTAYNALISSTVTKSQNEAEKYPMIDYTYWPIDLSSSSTYYLKTANQAYNDLILGEGFVLIEPKQPQVIITNVFLAYYQTKEYTPYLQPIYVFEGPEFQAYVPAINPQ